MSRMLRLTRIVTLVFLMTPATAFAGNETVANAINGFIRPAYRTFSTETAELVPALDALCKSRDEQALTATKAAFREAMVAWSEIEIVRIGPVTEENRLERILHWPDRKSIGLKQVQAALADEDPTATDIVRLSQKSIAMQGFGALEFVLFGTGADDPQSWKSGYRCRYGVAIAGNLARMAADISKEWDRPDGFAGTWENPSPDNALYRDDKESLTDLMDIFVHGTEMVRDVRTNGFLGAGGKADKPKQAIYWRSSGTVDSLAANISGLEKLFDASRMAALVSGDNDYLGSSIDFEFGNARRALDGLQGKPIDVLLDDSSAREKLNYFRVVTSSLTELFGTRLSAALGLSAGFSSLDGD